MIYKRIESKKSDYTEQEIDLFKESFRFDDIIELLHKSTNKKILNDSDTTFAPDLSSAIFIPFYKKDLAIKAKIYDAFKIHHLHLTGQLNCNDGKERHTYEFLGLILRDEEFIMKTNNTNEYYKGWPLKEVSRETDGIRNSFYENGVTTSAQKRIVKIEHRQITENNKIRENVTCESLYDTHPIQHIFPDDLIDEKVVFIIAGSQTLEWNYARIKKAAIVISDLIKSKKITPSNCLIIFSGRNNAKSDETLVNVSNEATVLQEILIHRLRSYLPDEKDRVILNNLHLEDKSTNTKENIREAMTIIKKEFPTGYSAFVISNTFHLAQINEELKSVANDFIPNNLFIVGSENPNDSFKTYDNAYIKQLYNKAIYLGKQTKVK